MKNESNTSVVAENRLVGRLVEALESLAGDLPKRSQEIIFSRFGISGKKTMTLEEIGKKYSITRERVRQVIREVFRKIKDKREDPVFQDANKLIRFTIEKNSGIMEESNLLNLLGKNDTREKGAIKFFLECLADVTEQEIRGELYSSYTTNAFSLQTWRNVKNAAFEVLKKSGEPLDEKELFEKVAKNLPDMQIDSKLFFDYLVASEELKKNNFGKWGIFKWKEVTPKGTREKAYLVLKEAGEPLHFKIIAQQIDAYHLNKKKTHPQTVHNELIKDKKFVLVGRGMYALAEWGYKKGTVKDVLAEILAKSDKPLSKEEILMQVLKVRHVKKSTIVINLNNFFKKTEVGYTIKK